MLDFLRQHPEWIVISERTGQHQGRATFNVTNGSLGFNVESRNVFGDFLGTSFDSIPNIFNPEEIYSLIYPNVTRTELSAKIHPLSNDFRSITFELEQATDSELSLTLTKVLKSPTAATSLHKIERETVSPYFYTLRLP